MECMRDRAKKREKKVNESVINFTDRKEGYERILKLFVRKQRQKERV